MMRLQACPWAARRLPSEVAVVQTVISARRERDTGLWAARKAAVGIRRERLRRPSGLAVRAGLRHLVLETKPAAPWSVAAGVTVVENAMLALCSSAKRACGRPEKRSVTGSQERRWWPLRWLCARRPGHLAPVPPLVGASSRTSARLPYAASGYCSAARVEGAPVSALEPLCGPSSSKSELSPPR